MLVPLLAGEGVVIMRVRPVAVGREQLPVSIVAIVVRGLALLLGEATHAAPPVQVIPVALAFSTRREVAQRQQLRACATVELVPLLVPQGVFYHRIKIVESVLRVLETPVTPSSASGEGRGGGRIVLLRQAAPASVVEQARHFTVGAMAEPNAKPPDKLSLFSR